MLREAELRRRSEAETLLSVLSLIQEPLHAVEAEIREMLAAKDPLIQELATHLLAGGGKRLRPAFLVLAGQALGAPREKLVPVGAALEVIHMATLVHDDVVDVSTLRRGQPTVNARWGTATSVLLGDYLYAKGLGELARVGDPRVVQLMSEVVHQMAQGEIEQIHRSFDFEQDEAAYLMRVHQKTGCFIAECCRLGAVLAGSGEPAEEALWRYGYGVGVGFQIIDDVLDFTSSANQIGKPTANDLRTGIVTLPIIYALRKGQNAERLRGLLAEQPLTDDQVTAVGNHLEEVGAFQYCYQMATQLAEQGRAQLQSLPQGPLRQGLDELARALVARTF